MSQDKSGQPLLRPGPCACVESRVNMGLTKFWPSVGSGSGEAGRQQCGRLMWADRAVCTGLSAGWCGLGLMYCRLGLWVGLCECGLRMNVRWV